MVRGGSPLTTSDRSRFDLPLYTVAEAARIIDVPRSTLATWVKGYVRRSQDRANVVGDAVITSLVPANAAEPSIPFVGLAEALVLAAVRRSGVPVQRIRPALDQLQRGIGVEHALASRELYTDGAELLFDYGDARRDTAEGDAALNLVVVRSGQRVFAAVIEDYLRRIEYAEDGYASLIHVPVYERAEVVADPTRSFGAPVFERGGARVDDVLHRFWAGESLDELSAEFGAGRPARGRAACRIPTRCLISFSTAALAGSRCRRFCGRQASG
jgi:uncharacterized protein (DUF433 family)